MGRPKSSAVASRKNGGKAKNKGKSVQRYVQKDALLGYESPGGTYVVKAGTQNRQRKGEAKFGHQEKDVVECVLRSGNKKVLRWAVAEGGPGAGPPAFIPGSRLAAAQDLVDKKAVKQEAAKLLQRSEGLDSST